MYIYAANCPYPLVAHRGISILISSPEQITFFLSTGGHRERGGGIGMGMGMGMEMDTKKKDKDKDKKSKRKKIKRDKWGQPLLPQGQEEEEDPVEEEEEALTAPESGAGGGEETCKVVASGMPYSTTEDEIRLMFGECGPIHQLQLSRFPDSGNFRGLAFITFETESAAVNALRLDGAKMGNRYIRIDKCRIDQKRKRKSEFLADPDKAEGCLSLYVGNLSWNVTEQHIRDCFKTSNISSIRFAFDKLTGRSRGFCHVDFEDDESLEKAIQKNQTQLQGRPMKIAYAVCKY